MIKKFIKLSRYIPVMLIRILIGDGHADKAKIKHIWFRFPYLPYFFHSALNILLLLVVKISKKRHFLRFCSSFLYEMFLQNKMISLPTYPKYFWHVIGTTYIFCYCLRILISTNVVRMPDSLSHHVLLGRTTPIKGPRWHDLITL